MRLPTYRFGVRGHESRLNRDLRLRFGYRSYAAEELVAALCGAFLCAEIAIDGDMRHAGYIQSWIGLLKHDCRAFFTACSRAAVLSTRATSVTSMRTVAS